MPNDSAREVERRLARVESPEPPADLLDRIRGDIPDYLRPVGDAEAPSRGRRRRYRLAAASLLLAFAGGLLAYRVWRQAPDPATPGPAATRPPAMVGLPPATRQVELYPAPTEAAATPPSTAASAAPETEGRIGEYGPAPAGKALRDEEAAVAAAPLPAVDSRIDELESVANEPVRAAESERPQAVGDLGSAEPREAGASATPTTAPAGEGSRAAVEHRRLDLFERLERLPGESRQQQPVDPSVGASTGGTAEPNDQPWGDMFFRPYGTNPFVDTEDDPQSTFGLDVDTGSYTLARSYLERRHLPPPEAIRVEEFLNYFDYRDPAPRRGEFTLTAEGAPSPWPRGPRYQLLRIGVRGREVSPAERRQATLVFVVDVSGSMARDDRIELVRQALHLLLDQLGPGDRVGLVVYGSRGQVLLEPSDDLEAVRRAIDRLSTGGSTNAEEGLLLGYELARRHLRPGSITRLVLCSDGVANVGRTGPESILARVGREAEEGIELTTVGFGMGNYNDVLMEQLADRGDGNYAYVDTLAEARRIFVENLTGTLQTLASDAKIQVEFDPRVVSRYRLLGYENRDVADDRFRDDTVDAGEIGAGHRVTALYEIKLAEEAPRRRAVAEVRLRYRSEATGRVVEETIAVGRADFARDWRRASPSLRLAALAAELAEVLKGSYWAREVSAEQLRQRARETGREHPGDRDVAELARLAERAAELIERAGPPGE